MIRRCLSLFKIDLLNIIRHKFLLVLGIVLAVMIITYHLLPGQIDEREPVYILDQSAGAVDIPRVLQTYPGAVQVFSVDKLEAAVLEKRGNTGIQIRPGITVELLYNGNMQPDRINLFQAYWEKILLQQDTTDTSAPFTTLHLEQTSGSLSLQQAFIPIMLTFEVLILGFLFIAVMIFQEKQAGTILAYRVSPGGQGYTC